MMNRLKQMFSQPNVAQGVVAGAHTGLEIGLFYIVRPKLQKILEPWTPAAVREAIRQHRDLFTAVDFSAYKAQVQPFASLIQHLELDTLVLWIGAIRPDLVVAVKAEPDGELWLKNQFYTLLQKLFG